MSEAELYKELAKLTKDKGRWKESMPYPALRLFHLSHRPYQEKVRNYLLKSIDFT